jgi:hypothetical protein
MSDGPNTIGCDNETAALIATLQTKLEGFTEFKESVKTVAAMATTFMEENKGVREKVNRVREDFDNHCAATAPDHLMMKRIFSYYTLIQIFSILTSFIIVSLVFFHDRLGLTFTLR